MNERITELAKEAKAHANHLDQIGVDASFEDIFNAKFAELIVRECLAQVDKVDTMLEDDKEKTGVAWVGLAIAKHFGVEE